jgi:hypothetical protein
MACWIARLESERDAARASARFWRREAFAARRDLPQRDLVGEIAAVGARLDALRALALDTGSGAAAAGYVAALARFEALGAAWVGAA